MRSNVGPLGYCQQQENVAIHAVRTILQDLEHHRCTQQVPRILSQTHETPFPVLLELLQQFHTKSKHFSDTLWKAIRCGATILKPHENQQACNAQNPVKNKVVPAPATQPQNP
jgi:hypothetical protein